jgi:hypothetical protein
MIYAVVVLFGSALATAAALLVSPSLPKPKAEKPKEYAEDYPLGV